MDNSVSTSPTVAEPLSDIMGAYHFASSLVGLYSALLRHGGRAIVAHRKIWESHADDLLGEIGLIYSAWDQERAKGASTSGAKVEGNGIVEIARLGHQLWLDSILRSANDWTPTRHWFSLAWSFESRWQRILAVLAQRYPSQSGTLKLLQDKGGVRQKWVRDLQLKCLSERNALNRSYAEPTDIAY